jgi:hypothetical protein
MFDKEAAYPVLDHQSMPLLNKGRVIRGYKEYIEEGIIVYEKVK